MRRRYKFKVNVAFDTEASNMFALDAIRDEIVKKVREIKFEPRPSLYEFSISSAGEDGDMEICELVKPQANE